MRPLQALAILVTKSEKKTKEKGKKRTFFFVIGSLRHLPTYIPHIRTVHMHASMHASFCDFLHISKQVPLFISALTEPR